MYYVDDARDLFYCLHQLFAARSIISEVKRPDSAIFTTGMLSSSNSGTDAEKHDSCSALQMDQTDGEVPRYLLSILTRNSLVPSSSFRQHIASKLQTRAHSETSLVSNQPKRVDSRPWISQRASLNRSSSV